MKKNKTYEYSGPVLRFETCVDQNWKAVTWAPSEKKARNNLIFRYKRDHDMAANVKISLPGKLTLKEE